MQDFNFRNALIIGLLLAILTYIGYSLLNLSSKVDSNHNYLIQRMDYLNGRIDDNMHKHESVATETNE